MIDSFDREMTQNARRSLKKSWKLWLVGTLAILIPGYCIAYPWTTASTKIVKITEKTVKQIGGDDEQSYLIGTDQGSFKIEDNWQHLQWSSFDLFSKLEKGQTYKISYYGWRFGWTSSFPILYAAEKVPE